MDTKIKKGSDGWEAITMLHIPGRPEQVDSMVTEQGNIPASDYMVVRINEAQPA